MILSEEMKKELEEMSYEEMLRKWRFTSIADDIFHGEIGNYYAKIMQEKRAKLPEGQESIISKRIGWDK
jgi:hypothetical protein